MSNWYRLLKGLNYSPNRNTPDAVKTIAKRPPPNLLLKWTGKASYYLIELNRQLNFEDLRRFIEKKADKVNTTKMKELFDEVCGQLPRHPRD